MTEFGALGRLLIVLGLALAILGAAMAWGPRVPWLGRLPGDFVFGGGNWRVHLPLGTCLVLSVVLSLLLRLWFRK